MANNQQKKSTTPVWRQYQPILWFGLISLLLNLQFLFSIRVEEPYPCIKLPGFGSIPEIESEVEIVNYSMQIYRTDKPVVELPCRTNLPTLPHWFVPYISDLIISKDLNEVDQKTLTAFKSWLKSQLAVSLSVEAIDSVTFTRNQNIYSLDKLIIINQNVLAERTYKFE